MRRSRLAVLLALQAALALPIGAPSLAAAPAQSTPSTPTTQPNSAVRLTLLGTGGGPIARVTRSQPAALIDVGAAQYLIDVGAGTERQIVKAGLRLNAIDAVFITHLHFDHTAGLPAFIALDWQDRRREPVPIIGPPGTRALVEDSLRFLANGEAIFSMQLPDLPPIKSIFSGRDFDTVKPAVIYKDAHVTVRAVENTHYATMQMPERPYGRDRSYAYRFETGDKVIVLTGDTGPSEAVQELAKGADILLSEIIDLPALLDSLRRRSAATGIDQQTLIDHMAKEHLTPEEVGKLAAAAGVGQVVLTHFATPPGNETINRDRMLAEIRKHYAGPVSFGEDLASY
jgi:ribonuclease BN (tRNA processing enzyme)